MRDLQRLVDAADTAALLQAVDGLCSSREWDRLADLAQRCRDAIEVGKQLWPVAMHIDYRLALEGPASHAAAVLRPGAARFALGPLTEVAASTHDWASLAPHLHEPATTAAVAQERVLRGEDLRGREQLAAGGAWQRFSDGMPLVGMSWEPSYALPSYRDRSAAFPQPAVMVRVLPPPTPLPPAPQVPADGAVQALRDLVEVWISQSAGTVSAVAVEGDAAGAVGRLLATDDGGRASLLRITPREGLAVLQWTGASGGAYGRRRGGAAGRFAAWWAVAMLTGLDWPPPTDELGAGAGDLQWYRWQAAEPDTGWVLRLAIADPVDGLAWAVAANDRLEDDASA